MNPSGFIDIHVHSAPDIRPRSCDDFQLAHEARRVGARAVVIKSHHVPTVDRATLAGKATPGMTVLGGITLNPSVGGLNPAAVEVALQLGGRIVWLPTLFARRHRAWDGGGGGIAVVEEGKTVPVAREIFRQIAGSDAVLATGHQAAAEIPVIVADAWAEGVRRIVVNHPEHRVVGMEVAEQRALVRDFPVYFERCYGQPSDVRGRYDANFEANLRAIEALGPDSTILASDVGQIENPPWTECWEQMFAFYSKRGLSESTWRRMTAENPACLLGLS